MTMRPVLTLFFLLTTLAGAADPSPEVARLAADVRGKGWIVFAARSEQGDWDRATLLARPESESHWRLDIRLQRGPRGETETVFLDI